MRTTWKRSTDNPPDGQTEHRLPRIVAASLLAAGMLAGIGVVASPAGAAVPINPANVCEAATQTDPPTYSYNLVSCTAPAFTLFHPNQTEVAGSVFTNVSGSVEVLEQAPGYWTGLTGVPYDAGLALTSPITLSPGQSVTLAVTANGESLTGNSVISGDYGFGWFLNVQVGGATWNLHGNVFYPYTLSGGTPPPPPPPTGSNCAVLPSGTVSGMTASAGDGGYWIADAAGQVDNCGGAGSYGQLGSAPSSPIVGITATADQRGYWLVGANGGIYSFGDAAFHGSMAGAPLNQPIVGMAADPATGGYWLVAADGGVFSFDAPFFGSTGNIHLNQPIVGMAATANGAGYWFVASDGGVFAYGNAAFHGSMGGQPLNRPVVGMASDPTTGGYWLVASDGGIFAFDAPFFGSTGSLVLNKPIVGMTADLATGGYWFVASDGGVFAFDAPFYGSAA